MFKMSGAWCGSPPSFLFCLDLHCTLRFFLLSTLDFCFEISNDLFSNYFRKRLLSLMQRAEYSANEKKKTNIKERKSIKDEERYKIIELHASGKDHARSRRSGDNVSKYRESKKPRELKRAIGKIDSDDWKIKNIEEKLVINTQGMYSRMSTMKPK